MRANFLADAADSRQRLFEGIAGQFPSHARVLNIGAGGDPTPVRAMAAAGHEVISTDMALSTVAALLTLVAEPVFACDLAHLGDALPAPVDCMIGNSVLGYVAPGKLATVVGNVAAAMTQGGVFTFDQTPHPHYFVMAEASPFEPIINVSAPHPEQLLAYVERYGIHDGINAMAYDALYRPTAVNLAVIDTLRILFARHGMSCRIGSVPLALQSGSHAVCLTLRVSRHAVSDILQPLPGETLYDTITAAFADRASERPPWLGMTYLDREMGERLARVLGIHRDRQTDPWAVARFVAENQAAENLSHSIRDEVIGSFSPEAFRSRIMPFVTGEQTFVIPRAMDPARAADQTLHNGVMRGMLPLTPEQADLRIDHAYAQQRQREALKAERKKDEAHRRDRKKRK
jgi:hypothetical protein